MRGHVRKRGNTYCIVVDVGRDESGKRRQRWFSGFRTKREAEKMLAMKIAEIESGGYVEQSKETVGSYLTRWLADKKPQIRHYTHKQYDWLIRVHITPHLGKYELSKLTPAQIQKFYRQLGEGEKPLSASSIRHTHRVLHEALSRAVKWGLISRNPADVVDPPRPTRYRATVWTPEQVVRFLSVAQASEPSYSIAFLLAVTTGMRQAEILGLQWKDVDWDRSTLRIDRTQNYIRGKSVIGDVKKESSRRTVALAESTLLALQHHRTLQSELRLAFGSKYNESGMIVASENGSPLSQNTLNHVWRRLLEAADVPRIRFHDLRHTHASLLLSAGVDLKVVSERLGHATLAVTADIYTHVLPRLQHAAAEDFDRLLQSEQGKLGDDISRH